MSTEASEGLLIRKAAEDDVPRVLEIFQEAFRLEADSESDLSAFPQQCPHTFPVAQVGEEIAGATVAHMRDERPHVHLSEEAVWKARAVPGKVKARYNRLAVLSGSPDGRQDREASKRQPEEVPKVESETPGPVHSLTADRSGAPMAKDSRLGSP